MDSPPPAIERICRMVEYTLQRPDDKGVVRRPLHAPSFGLLRGTIDINGDLPSEIAFGLFAQPRSFEAWVRFSRSYLFDEKEADTIGMAVKLLGTPGEKCLPGTPGEHDLITVNIPFSWVGNREHVMRHFTVLEKNKNTEPARSRKPDKHSRKISDLLPMNFVFPSLNPRKFNWPAIKLAWLITWKWLRCSDPVAQTFNTLTPSRLGEGSMKCLLRHVPIPRLRLSGSYRERLRQRLEAGPIRFDLLVQRRTTPDREPLDDATKVWESPLVKVGTLHIPPQDFESGERLEMEERISYSPYNALKAHEPLGSLNEVRKWAYYSSARNRSALCPFHASEQGTGNAAV